MKDLQTLVFIAHYQNLAWPQQSTPERQTPWKKNRRWKKHVWCNWSSLSAILLRTKVNWVCVIMLVLWKSPWKYIWKRRLAVNEGEGGCSDQDEPDCELAEVQDDCVIKIDNLTGWDWAKGWRDDENLFCGWTETGDKMDRGCWWEHSW